MRIEVLDPKDPRVWEACLKFVTKSKHYRGHPWALYEELAGETRGVILGVVDEERLVGVVGVRARGESKAELYFVWSEGKDIRGVVRDALRRLGFKHWYTYVWGPCGRGEAASRYLGAKVIAVVLEGEV